jgi:molybdopterin/thiamine biosynthesis adenylyltransferase/proteasome lid subunit RPN8/RPN11
MNTLRMLEHHTRDLVSALFTRTDVESAAYLRCTVVRRGDDITFLVREVASVAEEHYLLRTRDRLSISSDSFIPILKRAREREEAFVFIHTHPDGPRAFSGRDDREESTLFATVRHRVPGRPHASIVFINAEAFAGRVHLPDGAVAPLDRIVTIGTRLRVRLGGSDLDPVPTIFDRQVRAFGPDVQRVLRHLRVAIVGGGGTGSPVFEQCLRLGVGEILVVDHDTFDGTNVNRVYNSRTSDEGIPKVEIVERAAAEAGLPTVVRTIRGSINDPDVARELVWADVIFGCTDRELPRAILCRIVTRYLIPLLDLGVVVASDDGVLTGVTGRVTTVYPGTACLMCRERISPAMIRAESLPADERRQLAAEGYAPELGITNPAVIPFTTAVAAQAVMEFLHRVTGFMGSRTSTETLLQMDLPQIRSNGTPAEPWCDCANEDKWGRGDEEPLLGMAWPERPQEERSLRNDNAILPI